MKDQNVIDLNEFFYIIKKRKAIIISITLAAVIIVGIISYFVMSPVYESSSTVIIGSENHTEDSANKYNDVMMYQQLTKTYASLATSQFIEGKAAQKLGNGMTADKLNNLITVTPRENTQLIDIKAEGNTPEEALKRATAISKAFSENITSVYSIATVNIVDNGELPQSPSKPNKKLYVAIAFFIGLVVSIAIAISLERRTGKTTGNIKNKYFNEVEC